MLTVISRFVVSIDTTAVPSEPVLTAVGASSPPVRFALS
jgi:hypothetical protein